jgi:hypothetical protein
LRERRGLGSGRESGRESESGLVVVEGAIVVWILLVLRIAGIELRGLLLLLLLLLGVWGMNILHVLVLLLVLVLALMLMLVLLVPVGIWIRELRMW